MRIIEVETVNELEKFVFKPMFPDDLDIWGPPEDPPLDPVIKETYDSYVGLFFFQREGSPYFHSDIVVEKSYGWGISANENVNKKEKEKRPITYELEVDNLRVRNKFSANELIFQQKRAVNGSLIVSSTGKIKKISRTLIQNSQN